MTVRTTPILARVMLGSAGPHPHSTTVQFGWKNGERPALQQRSMVEAAAREDGHTCVAKKFTRVGDGDDCRSAM